MKGEEGREQASRRGVDVGELLKRGRGSERRGEIHLSMTLRATNSNTSSCLVCWLNTRLNLVREGRKRREGGRGGRKGGEMKKCGESISSIKP